MSRLFALPLLLVAALAASPANAALTVNFTPTESFVGQEGGTVSFIASIIGDANEVLIAYDFPIDISGVDLSAAGPQPVELRNFLALDFAVNGFSFSSTSPASSNRDAFVSAFDLTGGVSTSGGLNLFSFDAVFAPGIEIDRQFVFSIDPDGTGAGLSTTDGVVDLSTVTFNSATVTAVPEPSSWAALAAVGAFGAWRIRRRKANAAS